MRIAPGGRVAAKQTGEGEFKLILKDILHLKAIGGGHSALLRA